MDLAELICDKATKMHQDEIEKRKLTFHVNCNYPFHSGFKFELLPDRTILFNECIFSCTRTNLFLILNQILKGYVKTYRRNVSTIYLSISNYYCEVLNTQVPDRIRPPAKLKHMLHFDADMNVDTLNRAYEHMWKFVRRFRSASEKDT